MQINYRRRGQDERTRQLRRRVDGVKRAKRNGRMVGSGSRYAKRSIEALRRFIDGRSASKDESPFVPEAPFFFIYPHTFFKTHTHTHAHTHTHKHTHRQKHTHTHSLTYTHVQSRR